MTSILLVRHGENEYVKSGRLAGRQKGVHLNSNGEKQAKTVAELLKNYPIKAVYSSPLERTMETAAPIAEALSLEIKPRDGLIEIDVGDWQNKKIKALNRLRLWKTVQNSPSRMRFPSGESFLEAQFRISQELDSLALQYGQNDLIVCVSHSDIIKLAVAYFVGMPIDNFQKLVVDPASITILNINDHGSWLKMLNYDVSFTLSSDRSRFGNERTNRQDWR
jgi:probable phosphoglycerate mutase